ncbi:putative nitrogen fixation protein NifT [Sinorhizobium fredii]|uniref:putative nitrogen fixation protein NifT n=1 Tax=Rhizobium fredii TaxID=380 RepID=UPI0004B1F7CB|nr:putative nitrogen fixation protein NifT [Sinorhizobium fredii]ASY73965.1 NifT protein [Sinorhizobium fredii CCBAU 83666]
MKVTIRRTANGLSAYVPKKDLEEPIVEVENEGLWGGFVVLRNGWSLLLPDLPKDTRLPVTVEAKKIMNDAAGIAAQRETP